MKRLLPGALVVLAACVVVGTSLGAPDRKAPRIVAAVMQDRDGDARADHVRLRFSERIRHKADKDRKYPFRVSRYRIRSVGKARGRTLVLRLVEKSRADEAATPRVRYRRTRSKPVRDRAGNQAVRQTFRGTRAHGSVATGATTTPLPPPSPPPPPPNPNLPPDTDPDRDGYAAPEDCKPDDPAIHPSADDLPDLGFVDTNCDGIDGTEAKAVFASPSGNDANPGTKAAPKRQIQTAVAAAAATDRYVLAAAGQYGRVVAATGVGIYGGYDASTWSRSAMRTTTINGGPEGILASSATGVVLQYLSVVSGSPGGTGASTYGIRAINGASLTVERVSVTVGNGAPGAAGATGEDGRPGGKGRNGPPGNCDGVAAWSRAPGGVSPVGRDGGMGGGGGDVDDDGHGQAGATGVSGTPGGAGGAAGDPGKPGQIGENGRRGGPGSTGSGAGDAAAAATTSWSGGKGGAGGVAAPGEGGGGGGGGGGQTGLFVVDGTGNFGGGGGGGGEGGRGGGGGNAGGGSFGIYLHNSIVTVSASSSIAAGDGGPGGRGGAGGSGGFGGAGGIGGSDCTSEVGAGGNGGAGGRGGDGGGGGGGAGGPSIGIFKAGTSTATVTDSTVTNGTPGAGGTGGSGGTGNAGTGAPGIARPVYPS